MRRAPLLALAVVAACLRSPPDSVGDDGGGSDATAGADAAPGACASTLNLGLRSEEDLAGWTRENAADCGQETTAEGLEFTNVGNPATCRAYADPLVDLTNGQRLRLRLVDHDSDLSMTFSVVVGSRDVALSDRRWLYFDRDDGQLMFGECSPQIGGCVDTYWGSVTYAATEQAWLSFKYEPGDGVLLFETSGDGSTFSLAAGPGGLSAADVDCVAVELGSYEEDASAAPRRASFADLVFL